MKSKTRIIPNEEIAELLSNIATAYEIKNKGFFQINSYKNAADTIVSNPTPLQEIWQQDPKLLDDIPNIGSSILAKISYLFEHDSLHPSIVKTFSDIHPAVFTFTKVNGIGPKIAFKLTQHLKFSRDPEKSLDQLIKFAQQGKVRTIEGLGEKSEASILQNTTNYLGRGQRMAYSDAQKIANDIVQYLQSEFPQVVFEPLGSLRRQSQTVGDIDIAAQSSDAAPILKLFVAYPKSIQTVAQGDKKASIKILHDVRIDLMVQPKKSWGSLLQHFTGSKQHNVELRKYAQTLGYSLSEYGIKDLKSGQIHYFDNETDFYHFLKLNFIPPAERRGENEIALAKK